MIDDDDYRIEILGPEGVRNEYRKDPSALIKYLRNREASFIVYMPKNPANIPKLKQ